MKKSDADPALNLDTEEVAILLRNATAWLTAKASDLPPFRDDDAWRTEAEEVAALGRLVMALSHNEIPVADEIVRKMTARMVGEVNTLRGLLVEYRSEQDQHNAWSALLALLSR